ncbi:MAG TPA: polyphosphate kinase 1 [Acidimicrobiales bacterium]|nr:polyphosphate kinase 1 [Acidimicrobiales bacterium]
MDADDELDAAREAGADFGAGAVTIAPREPVVRADFLAKEGVTVAPEPAVVAPVRSDHGAGLADAPNPAQAAIESFGPRRFTNRELSRLDFGARLLELAEDERVPLLERVKFTAIFADLLDEFFQVRVAGLEDQVAAGVRTRSADGLRPGEQLEVIRNRVSELTARQDRIFLDQLVPSLAAAGVVLSDWSSLDEDDRDYLVDIFQQQIYPVLTPLAVDPGHPFPYISNLSLNLVVEVMDPVTAERRIARVKVPPVLPRFVVMADGERFVALEQVIAAHLDTLFPGMTIGAHETFRVTRNADLAVEEDEADDLLVAVELELQRRRFGRAVRLELAAGASPAVRELLTAELELSPGSVYPIHAPIDLSGLWAVYALDRPDLHEETWTPMTPPHFATANNEATDLFAVLRERNVLVHHPYDSFATSVEAFVAQAAEDPDVLGIKQTLYRTSGDSPIVASLIRAAELGKQVAALVELKARFDEQANIGWARALEEAGVHVVYGLVGLKTHSKTALVLRREEDGIRRYCHVGTGNYNSKTARIYEDLGLLTADRAIGADVGDLFNYLTGFSRHTGYRQILVSPVTMRPRLLELIEEQAAAGPRGRIVLKMNGLTDPVLIDGLYRASRAGVPIDLVVRGLCCLRPGIPELSETITVRSVVGQFLEHSRIFRFGGPDPAFEGEAPLDPAGHPPLTLLIGSADMMERNLDRRIEVLVPVVDPELQARLLEILALVLADDTNSWSLGTDRQWRRVPTVQGLSAQQRLKELALLRARRRRIPEAAPATA